MNSAFSRCGRCGNNCLLTINKFSNDEEYISGNRCERGLGIRKNKKMKCLIYINISTRELLVINH